MLSTSCPSLLQLHSALFEACVHLRQPASLFPLLSITRHQAAAARHICQPGSLSRLCTLLSDPPASLPLGRDSCLRQAFDGAGSRQFSASWLLESSAAVLKAQSKVEKQEHGLLAGALLGFSAALSHTQVHVLLLLPCSDKDRK